MKDKRSLLLLPFLFLPLVGLTTAYDRGPAVGSIEDLHSSSGIWENYVPIGALVYLIATLILLCIFLIVYPTKPHTARESTEILLIVKGMHAIFAGLIGILFLMFENEHGPAFTPYFSVWILFTLFLGGCLGYILMLCVAKSTGSVSAWYFIVFLLQFVFFLDFLSVFLLWRRLKKAGSETSDLEGIPAPQSKRKFPEALRTLLLIPGILLPFAVFVAVLLVFFPALESMSLSVTLLSVLFNLSILCNAVYVMTGIGRPGASGKLALVNMVVRLIQYLGYIMNIVLGSLLMLTIFTFPLASIITGFNTMCLIVTSILSLGATMALVGEGHMNIRPGFFLSLLNYIFCVDIIYAITMVVILSVRRYREKHPKTSVRAEINSNQNIVNP